MHVVYIITYLIIISTTRSTLPKSMLEFPYSQLLEGRGKGRKREMSTCVMQCKSCNARFAVANFVPVLTLRLKPLSPGASSFAMQIRCCVY